MLLVCVLRQEGLQDTSPCSELVLRSCGASILCREAAAGMLQGATPVQSSGCKLQCQRGAPSQPQQEAHIMHGGGIGGALGPTRQTL